MWRIPRMPNRHPLIRAIRVSLPLQPIVLNIVDKFEDDRPTKPSDQCNRQEEPPTDLIQQREKQKATDSGEGGEEGVDFEGGGVGAD